MKITVIFVTVIALAAVSGCSDDADWASEEQASDLAELLLTDADVAALLPQLSQRGPYSTGEDYGILGVADFAGPTENALIGVVRQWSQPYSWSVGDPVSDIAVSLRSEAIALHTPAAAGEAASEVIALARSEGATRHPAPDGFEAAAAPPGTDGEPRSSVATAVVGSAVIVVHLRFVGDGGSPDLFRAALVAAKRRLR